MQTRITPWGGLPRIIGLSGKKRHGKDTLGAQLARLGYRRAAFADALYAEVSDKTGVPLRVLCDPELKDAPLHELGGRSPRAVLQEYGMARRAADPEYWVRQVKHLVETAPAPRWVITDVRLPNEAAWVESCGVLVRVVRPSIGSDDAHISETALDTWPFRYGVVNRDGRPQEMLAELLDQLLGAAHE